MNYNDILRRVRYSLNMPDPELLRIFSLADKVLTRETLGALFLRDDDPGFLPCDSETLSAFLDGLVVSRRGRREAADGSRPDAGSAKPKRPAALSNNDVLKALRIALQLKDEDIIALMDREGVVVTKSELGALFRRKDHSNYRACGDQFLRHFIAGLARRQNPSSSPAARA